MRIWDHRVQKGLHSLRDNKEQEEGEMERDGGGLGMGGTSVERPRGGAEKDGFGFALGLGVWLGGRALDKFVLNPNK